MLKDRFGFNFWPSFTDLMLSLVLVVLFILFVVTRMIAANSENLDEARKSQEHIQTQIEESIGKKYKVAVFQDKGDMSVRDLIGKEIADIYIINKLDRQTITFSDKLLFDSGESQIKPAGYDVLNAVGPVIARNMENISEIQIQGHADITYEDLFNLNLASQRAISVYTFLTTIVGIDPSKYLMSATTFGKYKPVGREPGEVYNYTKLEQANGSEALKAQNRRIEIVLYYKNKNSNLTR